jgi:hypothetical protein
MNDTRCNECHVLFAVVERARMFLSSHVVFACDDKRIIMHASCTDARTFTFRCVEEFYRRDVLSSSVKQQWKSWFNGATIPDTPMINKRNSGFSFHLERGGEKIYHHRGPRLHANRLRINVADIQPPLTKINGPVVKWVKR